MEKIFIGIVEPGNGASRCAISAARVFGAERLQRNAEKHPTVTKRRRARRLRLVLRRAPRSSGNEIEWNCHRESPPPRAPTADSPGSIINGAVWNDERGSSGRREAMRLEEALIGLEIPRKNGNLSVPGAPSHSEEIESAPCFLGGIERAPCFSKEVKEAACLLGKIEEASCSLEEIEVALGSLEEIEKVLCLLEEVERSRRFLGERPEALCSLEEVRTASCFLEDLEEISYFLREVLRAPCFLEKVETAQHPPVEIANAPWLFERVPR
ncbi:hypothetical protein KM043_005533 [Ampulex compressa]|nr:hypothetical protein KM043_005533 [Ampulex compressa]